MKQEPVAWIYRHKKNKIQDLTTYQRTFDSEVIEEIPLYTAPKDLSDAEIMEVYKEVSEPFGEKRLYEIHDFARALLKKASEK